VNSRLTYLSGVDVGGGSNGAGGSGNGASGGGHGTANTLFLVSDRNEELIIHTAAIKKQRS
jgi:hypothetical protein